MVLAIHASAVQVNGEALIFLGPSGTGKTTLCGLLSAQTTPLANDVVYLLRRQDGRWGVADGYPRAYEGPLSEEEAAMLQTAPLRAIFRLFQARQPSITPIGALETCRYMTDALFEMAWQRDYDTDTKKAVFAALAAVCRALPGFEFRITRSPRTAEVLLQTVRQLTLPQVRK